MLPRRYARELFVVFFFISLGQIACYSGLLWSTFPTAISKRRKKGGLDCLPEVVREDLTFDPFSCRDDVMGVPLDASILHRDIVEKET